MTHVYESTHEEALSRLCFICGMIIKNKYRHDVVKNLDLIRSGLKNPNFIPESGVTPRNFCHKCHSSLRDLAFGKIVRSSATLLDWLACGVDCKTCSFLSKRKSTRGRPKKVIFLFLFFANTQRILDTTVSFPWCVPLYQMLKPSWSHPIWSDVGITPGRGEESKSENFELFGLRLLAPAWFTYLWLHLWGWITWNWTH